MKILKGLFGILSTAVFFAACSTVQVTEAWKDARADAIKTGKIMVVCKSNDNITRQRFERDMVLQVQDRNSDFIAVPSYKTFPYASPDEKYTPEKTEEIRKTLKELSVNLVIVTTVKTVRESTVTNVTADPVVYPYGGFGGYGYYSGFYRSGYYQGISIGYLGEGTSTAITSTEKEFVVETLLYDLSLPDNEQLLSVVTCLVDDPQSLVTTSKDFSKAVIKKLFKKL